MHLVHEEDHIAAAADLLQNVPQTLLELAPIFGARHKTRHVQAVELFVLELGRYISRGDPLGEPLCNGSLPHPRLPHQGGIVLILPAQDPDDRFDLLFPSDDGIHVRRLQQQILAELIQ